MRRLVWLGGIVLVLAGCGRADFDVLMTRQQQDTNTWTCPDGERVEVSMPGSSVFGSRYRVSMACIGLLPSCPSTNDGELSADDPLCSNMSTNVFAGTCVADFAAAFDPSGACSNPSGALTWANGARLDGSRENGIYYDSKGDVAFIVERALDVGVLDYRYARPK